MDINKKILEIRREIHQNRVLLNQRSGGDKIKFKLLDKDNIQDMLKQFNPTIKDGELFFNNLFQN